MFTRLLSTCNLQNLFGLIIFLVLLFIDLLLLFLYMFWNLISMFIYLFIVQIYLYLFLNLFSILVYLREVLVPFGSYLLFFQLSIIFWQYLSLSFMTVFHINSILSLIPVSMDVLNLIVPLQGLSHTLNVSFHWFILSFKFMLFVLISAVLLTQFHMHHCFGIMIMGCLLIM
jgi:hypothetical protein